MAEDRFITFFYAHLDGPAQRLHYANAGHNPPIVLHGDGSHERLGGGGGILGVFRDQTFASASIQLHSGDLVILFTDGVTEASDRGEEEFGERRFLELLRAIRASTPAQIQREIINAIARFNRSNWHDDVTLLILGVT
jgi:sigma-B regulation protein RsbU (phosphoserine phosphatase)